MVLTNLSWDIAINMDYSKIIPLPLIFNGLISINMPLIDPSNESQIHHLKSHYALASHVPARAISFMQNENCFVPFGEHNLPWVVDENKFLFLQFYTLYLAHTYF